MNARWGVLTVLALLILPSVGVASRPAAEETRYVVTLVDAPALAVGDLLDGARVVDVNAPLRAVSVLARDADFRARAASDPRVARVDAAPTLQLIGDAPGAPITPNDPTFLSQSALQAIHVPEAWGAAHTFGDASTVAVCVVDTGLRVTHEDIAGSRLRSVVDLVHGGVETAVDDVGHGTHVAGIAAATIDNGLGIAGVANVSLYAAKALDESGTGSWDTVASAIVWCTDHTPPHAIISLSLGGSSPLPVLGAAVQYALDHGKLLVAAAGNGACNDCVEYPARYPGVIAVSCIDLTDVPCGFSSKGPQVSLAAPGLNIVSTGSQSDNAYMTLSGSSMSTPFVSGALALAWSALPSLTASDLRARLLATARDVGARGHDDATGAGVLDARCLVTGESPCAELPPTVECGAVVDAYGYACHAIPLRERALPPDARRIFLSDESDSAAIPIGFDFSYYGSPVRDVFLSSNGFLTFAGIPGGPSNFEPGCCVGQELPDGNAPNNLVAAYWSDLDPGAGGLVRTATLGAAPHREFVAEWREVPIYGGAPITAQVVLHEGTDVIETILVHGAPGPVHVIGIESPAGNAGLRADYGANVPPPEAFQYVPPTHLGAPLSFLAATGDAPGSIALSWQAPSIGAAAITGYRLFRGTDAGFERLLVSLPASETSYVDQAPDAHARYHYRLQAYQGCTGCCTQCASGLVVGPAAAASAVSGGDVPACAEASDAAGYTCAVVPFAYRDIVATGTRAFVGDDVVTDELPIGFPFTYYGRVHDRLFIGSNGFIAFDPGTSQACCQGQSVHSAQIRDAIAGLWDDLYAERHGLVSYQRVGVAPDRAFILAWDEVSQYSNGERVSTEIVLHEDNSIEVQTRAAPYDGGHARTIGLIAPTSTNGVEYRTGRFSLSEAGVLFRPPAVAPPAAPHDLRATPGDGALRIAWETPASAAPVLGYLVTRDDGCDAATLAQEGPATFFLDQDAPPTGWTIHYSVVAYNAAGAGPSATLDVAGPTGAPAPCVTIARDPAEPDGLDGYTTHAVTVTAHATGAIDPTSFNLSFDDGATWTPGDHATLTTTRTVVARVADAEGATYESRPLTVPIDTEPLRLRVTGYVCCRNGGPGDRETGPAPTIDPSKLGQPVHVDTPVTQSITIQFLGANGQCCEEASMIALSAALRQTDGWHVIVYDNLIQLTRDDGSIRAPAVVLGASATDAHGVPLGQDYAMSPNGQAIATTLTIPPPDGSAGWYRTPPTASLSVTPAGARITYHLENDAETVYAGPFPIPRGVHILTFNATSPDLPAEPAHHVVLLVDDQPPVVGTLHLAPASPLLGDNVALSVPVSDALSGVANAVVLVNGRDLPTSFDGRFANATLANAALGDVAVRVRSQDAAGNSANSSAGTFSVRDEATPVTTATVTGTPGNGGWWRSDATVALQATPQGSVIHYTLDGGSETLYVSPLVLSDGVHALAYHATGSDGSNETTRSLTVRVDAQRPSFAALVLDPPAPRAGDTVHLVASVVDATSGVAGVSLLVDGQSVPITTDGRFWNATVGPLATGTHTYNATATDVAGNVQYANGTLDAPLRGAPVTTIHVERGTLTAGWDRTLPVVTLTADPSDAVIHYALDEAAPTTYTGAITIPVGLHTLHYNATRPDSAFEPSHDAAFKVDTTAPAFGSLAAPTAVTSGDDIALSVPVTDDLSGVALVTLRANGADLATTLDQGVARATLKAGAVGALHVSALARDAAGNERTSELGVIDVRSRLASAPGAPRASFAAGRVHLEWTPPTDFGAPAATSYNLYRDGVLLTTQPATVFEDANVVRGRTYTYSVAAVGERQGAMSAPTTFAVPPPDPAVSTLAVSPAAPDGAGGWYTTPPRVTLAVTPADGHILVRLDDASETPYGGPFTIPSGRHTLHWRATRDGAANETEHTQAFQVDDGDPVLDSAALGAPNATLGGGVPITVRAHDDGSGLASVRATLSDGTEVALSGSGDTFAGTLTPRAVGAYSVTVTLRDAAGRTLTAPAGSFTIDPVPTPPADPTGADVGGTTPPVEDHGPSPPPDGSQSSGPAGRTSGGGSGTGTTSGATTESPAPPAPVVVIRQGDPTLSLDVGARGEVFLEVQNAPHPERIVFVAIERGSGNETSIGSGPSSRWNTTSVGDGYYDVEARERQDDGSYVRVASATLQVRNRFATPLVAASAIAVGAATAVVTNFAVSAITSTTTSTAASAASSVVTTSGGSSGFNLLTYLKELITDAGSDVLRDRTKNVADIERKRKIKSAIAVVATVALIAIFYSIAEADSLTWAAFVETLPVVGVAAVIIAAEKYTSETVIDRLSGARVRFRLWIAGIAALLLSTLVFHNPFGYPGYVDNGEEETTAERKRAGHRALAILGITAAWSFPFLLIGRFDYAMGSIGLSMALTVLATSAMPFGPLPGGEVWRWNKPTAIAACIASLGVYIAYETALLPESLLLVLGTIGIAGYALTALHYHRHKPTHHRVPVQDMDAKAPAGEGTKADRTPEAPLK